MRLRKQWFTETSHSAHEPLILDLGNLSECARTRVPETFDRLGTGDKLEIQMRREPSRLFAELRYRYSSGFYWWPLERGPVIWRVMLDKPTPAGQSTITGMMKADHRRLYELWGDAVCAVARRWIDCIPRRLGELSIGLGRHFDIEETILFRSA